MAFVWILSFAFFMGATSAFDFHDAVGTSNSTVNSTLSSYPSIVQVESLQPSGVWQQSCAASILNSRYVLSAASCFSGPGYQPQYRRIRAGANNRHTGGIIIYVERENNYPRGNGTDQISDISVVRLARPLTYSNLIRQTPIPQAGTLIPYGVALTQAGWGRGSASYLLSVSPVYTVNSTQCGINTGNQTTPSTTANILCAGGFDEFQYSNADVGSPWLFGNITIGVVSGLNLGNHSWTGILGASVSSFTDWILRTAV